MLFLLDTGCRISEALALSVNNIDFDNLLVTLDGKGRKQRIVPFSVDLRRALYRRIKGTDLGPYDRALWDRHNVIDWVKRTCRDLGFEPPARTLQVAPELSADWVRLAFVDFLNCGKRWLHQRYNATMNLGGSLGSATIVGSRQTRGKLWSRLKEPLDEEFGSPLSYG